MGKNGASFLGEDGKGLPPSIPSRPMSLILLLFVMIIVVMIVAIAILIDLVIAIPQSSSEVFPQQLNWGLQP